MMGRRGFTLIEVMISLAIVGGMLVTLIYTLNHHLTVAERQSHITTATNLSKEKMREMETKPVTDSGTFPDPYTQFSYETVFKDSHFPGMIEISVIVRGEKETVKMSELIRRPKI